MFVEIHSKRSLFCDEALLTSKTKRLIFFFFSNKAGRLHKVTFRVAIVRKRLGPKCTNWLAVNQDL